MKIKIIAPLPSISKRTRLTKIVENLHSFEKISFYGWQRQNDEYTDPNSKIILKGGGYSSKKARLMYALWSSKVFINSLSFEEDTLVWALGFESAFPAILASKIKGFKVIYDDADRFSSLFNFPFFIKKPLIELEKYSSKKSFKHIIPGLDRYEFNSSKFFILKNTPTTNDIKKAHDFILDDRLVRKLESFDSVIYVNGWLGEGRGMRIIHDVAKRLPNKAFLLAGRIDSTYAEAMVDFENVIYLGELPQYQALAYYRKAHFIFTYYDPTIPINKKAEANKWGDALQFSVPIIVNSEVITAGYLRDSGCTISHDYEDVDSLVNDLEELSSTSLSYKELVSSIEKMQQIFEPFDQQLLFLFNDLD